MTEKKQPTPTELNERKEQITKRIYEIQTEQEKLNNEYGQLYWELMGIKQKLALPATQTGEESP